MYAPPVQFEDAKTDAIQALGSWADEMEDMPMPRKSHA